MRTFFRIIFNISKYILILAGFLCLTWICSISGIHYFGGSDNGAGIINTTVEWIAANMGQNGYGLILSDFIKNSYMLVSEYSNIYFIVSCSILGVFLLLFILYPFIRKKEKKEKK